jgi:hypothetical protein
MGFGRADDHTTVNFGDRFDDLDPAPSQVDPAGGKGHELAPAQAGVGQDSDERVVRHAGRGQRLYLIMSEETLGRGHNAREGYALGDVPDEPSIADGRCEGQRQDSVGVPNGCRSKSLVDQAVHPARNVRVGDSGQGHEFPARQDLATERDLVAHHRCRLQLHLKSQPLRQPFAYSDLGQGRIHPLATGNSDLVRSPPLLGITLAREVRGVLTMTNNLRQLNDPDECTAIKKSGVHLILYETPDGLRGLALASAAICAAIRPLVGRLVTRDRQHIARIRSISPTVERFTLVDPALDPPSPYWP